MMQMEFKSKRKDQSKGCDQILREEINVEENTGDHLYIYAQVLREESLGVLFITNVVFFFAGIVTVIMSYSLFEILWVVSVILAHSHGGKLMIGISMKLQRRNGQCSSLESCYIAKTTSLGTLVTYLILVVSLQHIRYMVVNWNAFNSYGKQHKVMENYVQLVYVRNKIKHRFYACGMEGLLFKNQNHYNRPTDHTWNKANFKEDHIDSEGGSFRDFTMHHHV